MERNDGRIKDMVDRSRRETCGCGGGGWGVKTKCEEIKGNQVWRNEVLQVKGCVRSRRWGSSSIIS